ncbi:cytochrome P450 [Massilia sp. PAMC28688]|uniref:cytochrome P450 n=1 Tax=Massilia sp. PAMC28688 TaxID=2861283 RepID=UPI001C63A6AA|nr:cytochrome P450 [Massilia sp. PAMC28688]QYF91728.1 cytochrome P450 [Massilia sp. PAMC28688]
MKTTPDQCPFHARVSGQPPAQAQHAPGAWPAGPPSGFTGWGLLRRMSADLMGSLDEWRRQYGDIVHLRIWPEHQVVVADPAMARELLVTHHAALIRWERGIDVFSQVHGHSVLTAEGTAWDTKRKALQPGFYPKPVQKLLPAIAAAGALAFARWQTTEESWPIESALTSLGMDVILQTMFSSTIDADARQAEHAVRVVSAAGNAEMYWPVSLPDWLPWKRDKRRAIAWLKNLIERHVAQRMATARAAWPDDLLARLLALHLDDPATWPLQAVRDECMTTFLAGHETAAATLTWWAWCMAANPLAQAAARDEVDTVLQGDAPDAQRMPSLRYLTQTVQETLRLYPAAPVLMTRRSRAPIALGAWQFPARTIFTIPIYLLHHDARAFHEPHQFLPERFGEGAPAIVRGALMPFGAGPRVCLGQHLAMTEICATAAMLLQRFSLAIPKGMAPPEQQFNITLRPAKPLHLRLIGRG